MRKATMTMTKLRRSSLAPRLLTHKPQTRSESWEGKRKREEGGGREEGKRREGREDWDVCNVYVSDPKSFVPGQMQMSQKKEIYQYAFNKCIKGVNAEQIECRTCSNLYSNNS